MSYVVGHVLGKVEPVCVDTLQEAEELIKDFYSDDPVGVDNGDYYIDGPSSDKDIKSVKNS